MALRPFTKREKVIFGFCFCLILFALIFYGICRPVRRNLKDLNLEIQRNSIQIAKGKRILQDNEHFIEVNEEFLEKFKQQQNNEQMMTKILGEIEGQAKDVGFPISEIKSIEVKENKGYNQFSISLKIESSFIDILKFIYNLQRDPFLFNVENLTFNKGLGRSNQGKIRAHLSLSKILIP